jgi:protein-S-isoprenylcysteine O-methyltransferase Ste14
MKVSVHGIIGCIFVLVVLVVSTKFYNHRGRWYSQGKEKQIAALPGFGFLYRYVQVSTLVASVASFLSDHPATLKVYHEFTLLYVGLALGALAFPVFIWAKITLGAHYSPCFDSFVPGQIVDEGPYAYVRHPIYTSNLLLLLGLFIATGSLWLAINFVIVGIYYVTSARKEEEALREQLPAYREYAARTGGFVPRRNRRERNQQ